MQEVIYNTEDFIHNAEQTALPKENFKPYPLVDEKSNILWARLNDFDFSDLHHDPAEIASRLIETAKFHDSLSVTANQCGLRYKIFVAGSGDEFVAFFNPEIISYSDETCLMQEIDLSNMGLMLSIKRPKSISLYYQDYTGEVRTHRFDGISARIIQQNVDRLNGVDFKSKVSGLILDRAIKARNKKVKRFVRNSLMVK